MSYPADPNRLLAAGYVQSGSNTYLGAFLSTNGGTSWTQVKIANESGSTARAAAIAPSNVKTIYAAGHTSSWAPLLFRSTDNGVNWSQIAAPSSSSQILSLAIHPASPNTLIVTTSWGGTFKSIDGGGSWTKLEKAPLEANCVVWNPSNPNEIFVGSREGVFYSADGGATWTDLSAGLAAKNVVGIEIDGPGRMVYVGIFSGGICRRSF